MIYLYLGIYIAVVILILAGLQTVGLDPPKPLKISLSCESREFSKAIWEAHEVTIKFAIAMGVEIDPEILKDHEEKRKLYAVS